MRSRILVTALLAMGLGTAFAALPAPVKTPARTGPAAALAKLGDDYWEFQMSTHPTWATYLGDHRWDHKLEDQSPKQRARTKGRLSRFAIELGKIDAGALSVQDRVTHKILARALATELEGLELGQHRWSINQMDGPHVNLLELPNFHPTDTPKGLADLAARLEALPVLFAQVERNWAEGLAMGCTAPRVIVERVVGQLERILATPDDKSPFAPVIAKAPPAAARRLREALAERVRPAYERMLRFVRDRYLPRARRTVGISSMPGGSELYRYLSKKHTTVDLAPGEIHKIGLAELASIRAEADAIAKRHGHRDAEAFFAAIRKDPRNFSTTREGVLERYRQALERANAALPKAFSRLPKAPCIVKPLEEFRERESPAAYYYSAPHDRSRPAVFYANTYDPASRPLYNATALTVHEAVPGHHLQIAIAQEIPDLPMFRREADFTAYTEGWGLYSERLADELGLYEDDLARAGMLTYQAWRACRLVVDTGMHALGWSRERAIDFMKKNLALSEKEIVAEVERYITWPGQALAYMIGKREIVRIRQEAEAKLGKKFDIKAFHEVVLRSGAVPLSVLADEVQAWVDSVK